MSVSVEQFQEFVGTNEEGWFIDQCLDVANELVTKYVGDVEVPTSVLDNCILEVASEVFHRRSAPAGNAQFASNDGTPMQVPLDVKRKVYRTLQPFVGYAV